MQTEFRQIRPDELEECLDLWGNVFERVGRDYFIPYFYGDPWFKRVYTRVCSVDGKLVSAVQICERNVCVGDAEIVMGGIGNVGTYPEFRGRGYSSRLMEDTVRVMRKHGMDISVLFTGIQPFYESAGWCSVPQRILKAEITPELPDCAETRYSVRECNWAVDLAAISAIYDIFNKGRPLTTIRTPEYWSGYALPHFGKPEHTLVAEIEGKPVGYLFFGYDRPNCWLKEIGYLPGHEACAQVLTRGALSRAWEADIPTVRVNLPQEPEILDGTEQFVESIEAREPMGMMCRVINMHSLGERILPELERRAQENQAPPGSISLETELGNLNLRIEKGRVSLGAEDPVRIRISQSDFFCLLFGIKGVEELGLGMPGEVERILSALFPQQHPVFWLVDHF